MHQPAYELTIDIGGEGRHTGVWNINPRRTATLGPNRGQPIPQLIVARADALPFPAQSVKSVILERTPLTIDAVREISRVIQTDGEVVLRHVPLDTGDRHAAAVRILGGTAQRNLTRVSGQEVLETTIIFSDSSSVV